MGQGGIHSLNKVGYSMFWSSMWDNNITYNRLLKEDLFLKNFLLLAFNDSLSVNTINFKKKYLKFYNKRVFIIEKDINSNFRYLKNFNKLDFFSTKLWILKYQNWLILYSYIYIPNKKKLINNSNKYFKYKNNFFYSYKFYLKQNFNFFKNFNNLKKINF